MGMKVSKIISKKIVVDNTTKTTGGKWTVVVKGHNTGLNQDEEVSAVCNYDESKGYWTVDSNDDAYVKYDSSNNRWEVCHINYNVNGYKYGENSLTQFVTDETSWGMGTNLTYTCTWSAS